MQVVAQPGELTFTVQITRKDSGKTELYKMSSLDKVELPINTPAIQQINNTSEGI